MREDVSQQESSGLPLQRDAAAPGDRSLVFKSRRRPSRPDQRPSPPIATQRLRARLRSQPPALGRSDRRSQRRSSFGPSLEASARDDSCPSQAGSVCRVPVCPSGAPTPAASATAGARSVRAPGAGPPADAARVGRVAGSLGSRGAKTWRPGRGRGSLKK